MSEYQYYEFLAVDRPLTTDQMDELRKYSTRATISTTRFVNEYDWGNFRGDPDQFCTRFFDLMLYYANWGTHQFLVGVPKQGIPLAQWRRFEAADGLEIRQTDERVLIDFFSEIEEWDEYDDDPETLATLAPIRADLLAGDVRPLYLAWLAGVSNGSEKSDAPPVPAGMKKLTPAQRALADFLRVDEDLLSAAAKASEPMRPAAAGMRRWISALPQARKDQILLDLLLGEKPNLAAELVRQYRQTESAAVAPKVLPTEDLRELADAEGAVREAAEREAEARREAKRAREEAAAARKRLTALARRVEPAWDEVDGILTARQSKHYPRAISILRDLHALAVQKDALRNFTARLATLCSEHQSKHTFIKQLQKEPWLTGASGGA